MAKIISYLTFIPWILFYSKSIIGGMKTTKNAKSVKDWFKKNKNKFIHFENILIISIYVYFSLQDNLTVIKMLFVVTNLYFFINAFYDTRVEQKNSLSTSDISPILIAIMLSFIPFIYFMKTNSIRITYYIMYGYALLNYIIVFLSRMVDSLLNKIFKRYEK